MHENAIGFAVKSSLVSPVTGTFGCENEIIWIRVL
jgi:hypothetical protein